jgi:hypothetical protein
LVHRLLTIFIRIDDDDVPLLSAWDYIAKKHPYLSALVNGETEELPEGEQDKLEACLKKVCHLPTFNAFKPQSDFFLGYPRHRKGAAG